MDTLTVLLYGVIILLPAFYAAKNAYFIDMPNKQMNSYALRFLILFPFFTGINFVLAMPLFIFNLIVPEVYLQLKGIFSNYILLVVPLSVDLFLFVILNRYILPKKEQAYHVISKKDFDFYIFLPIVPFPSSKLYGTKYTYPKKRKPDELLTGMQIGNLVMSRKILFGHDIIYTGSGDVIISERALTIFNEEGLTGWELKPVEAYQGEFNTIFYSKKNEIMSGYFQLVSYSIMPAVSSKTEILRKCVPHLVVKVKDDMVYYDRKSTNDFCDFNRSLEYFGTNEDSKWTAHRYWVISKKAFDVLQNRLNLEDENFMPVYIIEDNPPTDT